MTWVRRVVGNYICVYRRMLIEALQAIMISISPTWLLPLTSKPESLRKGLFAIMRFEYTSVNCSGIVRRCTIAPSPMPFEIFPRSTTYIEIGHKQSRLHSKPSNAVNQQFVDWSVVARARAFASLDILVPAPLPFHTVIISAVLIATKII